MKAKIRLIGAILVSVLILSATAGGFWYWYDNNVDRSGWVQQDGVRIYQDFHADPVSGWLELDGNTYFFRQGGIPHTGWLEIEEHTYYFDASGVMATGWLELDGKVHYLSQDGTLTEGWLSLEDRYYFRDGAMVTGWQTIDEKSYYFDENGAMALGFRQVDRKVYYFGDDGAMQTGLIPYKEKTYLFQDNGTLYTGWMEVENGRRYFREDGSMALGWWEVDGVLCFFNEDGIQQHAGWKSDGEYRYYVLEDGSYAVGPTVIDGQTHYFTPDGIEVILVNGLNPIPDYFTQELVNVVDYHDVDARCYEALTKMLADCEDAGIEYTFNSAHRTLKEQITILEYRTLEHMRDFELDFQAAREKALDTVAIPGTSEHHLGLAVDLLGTEAVKWLTEHCWEYGFIVRYTAEKESITGIIDEPWHFRYVGTRVSMAMKDTGLCLEEYLGAPAVTRERLEAVHGDKWYVEEFTVIDEETVKKYLEPETKPAATPAA